MSAAADAAVANEFKFYGHAAVNKFHLYANFFAAQMHTLKGASCPLASHPECAALLWAGWQFGNIVTDSCSCSSNSCWPWLSAAAAAVVKWPTQWALIFFGLLLLPFLLQLPLLRLLLLLLLSNAGQLAPSDAVAVAVAFNAKYVDVAFPLSNQRLFFILVLV